MGEKNKRPFVPILLVTVGFVLLIGSIVTLVTLSSRYDISQEDSQIREIPYPNVSRVDLLTAKAAFDNGDAVFVDVRDQQYYENAHIPRARSIPLNQFSQRLKELDPNDWIILYCT